MIWVLLGIILGIPLLCGLFLYFVLVRPTIKAVEEWRDYMPARWEIFKRTGVYVKETENLRKPREKI